MSSTNRFRAVAAVAVAAVLGLTLSGCVATAANIAVHVAMDAKKATSEAHKPTRGQCWQATYKDVDGYANWGPNRPAVACSTTHQLYTFGVPTLKGTYKGSMYTTKGFVRQSIEDDAYDTCQNAQNTALSTLHDTVARIYLLQILPEEAQWNAGARWVRCDVGVLAVGSSVAHPAFESLPASETLYDSLRNGPGQYDFCVNDPGGIESGGPKGSNAVYADCRFDPEWKLVAYQPIRPGQGVYYPTQAELKAQYELTCEHPFADATHVTYPYSPSKSDWNTGDQDLECWVGRA
jgi:hypothetical protein